VPPLNYRLPLAILVSDALGDTNAVKGNTRDITAVPKVVGLKEGLFKGKAASKDDHALYSIHRVE
jgi:hypothetical protein